MVKYKIIREKVENELLMALLEAKGLSVTAAARKIGINKSQLSSALHNKDKMVSNENWKKIALFFIGGKNG